MPCGSDHTYIHHTSILYPVPGNLEIHLRSLEVTDRMAFNALFISFNFIKNLQRIRAILRWSAQKVTLALLSSVLQIIGLLRAGFCVGGIQCECHIH